MSDPKLVSPMLDGFAMGEPISDYAGVRCCPAMKNDADDRYIVKIVSNPASQQRLQALLLTGAYPDAESAKSYFQALSDEVVGEIETLKQLSELGGFLPVKDYQVVPMDAGETGYDVYILTHYRRTLEKQFRTAPMTHLNAINLGLDICSALSVCRRAGYLFVDLKPSNIHVVNGSEYRIADIGFVSLNTLKYASLPDKYRSVYTAPEVADAFANISTNIDIYALGLILYRAYNGGDLPFSSDQAPAVKFDPPAYADYEMAEIILKACDPDPAQRWEDPEQMGQALVSYMQRNGANDTPIVPPVIEQPPVPEVVSANENGDSHEIAVEVTAEAASESIISPDMDVEIPLDEAATSVETNVEIPELQDVVITAEESNESAVLADDDVENLSFLPEEDETTQELFADEIEYEEISEEVSQILSQVDEIATYEVPEPVVAPEAVDISVIEQTIQEDLEAAEQDSAISEEPNQSDPLDVPVDEKVDDTDDVSTIEAADMPQTASDEEIQPETKDEDASILPTEPKPKRRNAGIITAAILAILGAAIIAGGILFYQFIYLQEIDNMEIFATETTLSVKISTDVDESKLVAVCTDSYGTKTTKPITNGEAEFTDLLGGTKYTVTIKISGFHKLTGDIEESHYTPIRTNIVQFDAVVGPENGSALITFAPDGPDAKEWMLTYAADGETEQTITFEGHTVTVKGLTVGKVYKLALSSANQMYLAGEKTILFTAGELIYPEGLAITSFKNGGLTAMWSAPEGVNISEWTVRCYNTNGYNETLTTDQTSISFTNIDIAQDYTVEVSAKGQSVSQRTTVEENSLVLENMSCQINSNGQISMNWECGGQIPQGGWDIICSIRDTDIVKEYNTEENSFVIKDTVPGHIYEIDIKANNDAPVVCSTIVCDTGAAKVFSCTYAGATLTGNDITLSMCKTPNKINWTRKDLIKSDYTTSFKIGQKASFVIRARKLYGLSNDEMVVTYAIYTKEGKLISIQNENLTWNTMWDYYYGELNIPSLPSDPGEYKVVVYYNSGLVGEQAFTVES